ncbi:TetR/AcrR family transcriptional regulator [Roseinatronobacter alkalisoli]|uniref:TetR/AcrR family transcriptional regulator n=1 Tax=Roseinatronobacter alkalisoli TaxID=3028235 RepID=A0ABT5T4M8_9RHOB|nr:TetR/AcrR family transcriptional regulator [Roseinatronobacter sp. HJB301]MDD7969665.1 TetR/AcrR family transcriptional regulator [Roseinatronobacter sp. HJB301]
MKKSESQNDTATAIREAAERLFSERGFAAVSLREIAREAGVVVSSVSYHYEGKLDLLQTIYDIHTIPMNARRLELLGEARQIADLSARLRAILRAYLLPTFSFAANGAAGGGARFTRMRAVLSAEGDPEAKRIIAAAFDGVTRSFLDAIAECLPGADRRQIVWRSQFLLGALYYTLINPERIERLSDGATSGTDHETAIRELVDAAHASFRALSREHVADYSTAD